VPTRFARSPANGGRGWDPPEDSYCCTREEEASTDNSDIVFMYYDESASFKGREENYRANSYIQQNAMNSNHDSNESDVIFGDVFLVRMQNNQPRSMNLVDLKDILCDERSK